MNDIDRMIAVMQAAKEGKAIQSRLRTHRDIDEFWSYVLAPSWDWSVFDYRVKPAEPRKVWMIMYPTMGGRSYVCYNSREEAAATRAFDQARQQVEIVEVLE